MIRISPTAWLRIGAALLVGGLAMILVAIVKSYQGESVPELFFLSGLLLAFVGGMITIELAQRYCRIERTERESGS
jgi:hypothetical protein